MCLLGDNQLQPIYQHLNLNANYPSVEHKRLRSILKISAPLNPFPNLRLDLQPQTWQHCFAIIFTIILPNKNELLKDPVVLLYWFLSSLPIFLSYLPLLFNFCLPCVCINFHTHTHTHTHTHYDTTTDKALEQKLIHWHSFSKLNIKVNSPLLLNQNKFKYFQSCNRKLAVEILLFCGILLFTLVLLF